MTAATAVAGILLLMVLAVGVGASLDTEAQRVSAREAARGRRERTEELRALQEERRKLRDERVRRAEERRRQRDEGPGDDRPT